MSLFHSPKVVTDGLVFYYDMSNTQKSFQGPPTTNISAGIGIGTYLNTPSDVTSSLTVTTESYRGQPVYKQVLTPVTATGVSYLTNAGNPGIGTVTGGGGGAAARFTGHSIFFKPAVGRSGLNSSTPIYTHYSNIGGWQSSGNYDDMGDGWYRAHVIFYSAGGGSDGKYWAINPAGATLNIPITVYWAAPFKEDRNDSTFVSPYTNNTRSNTQAIFDLTNNSTITASSLTYASNNTFSFNGSNYASVNAITGLSDFTVEIWFKSDSVANYRNPIDCNWLRYPGSYSNVGPRLEQTNAGKLDWIFGDMSGNYEYRDVVLSGLNSSVYHCTCLTKNGNIFTSFYNGSVVQSAAATYTWPGNFNNINIGRGFQDSGERWYIGQIPSVKTYNRALTAAEVKQNFNALRGKYGL